jgi:hypothetical protein
MREREVRYRFHHNPHNNGNRILIPKTQNMYVIKKQENTVSRDKDNLSSVGTDRPPNH